MENKITIKQFCASLEEQYEILGDSSRVITNPAPIDCSEATSISFCSRTDPKEALKTISMSRASTIVCASGIELDNLDIGDKTLIVVDNPRKTFIRLMSYFVEKVGYGISPAATVDEGADVHPEVYIGPNTYISAKVKIGQGSIIHSNVSIHNGTEIGKNVTIHSGTVIGATGFGYERDDNGEFIQFPHVGGVRIADDVEIGANTCIDRGTLGNTIIGKGTKIDNLCHIAHNVEIGKHSAIIALTLIGGSTKIGAYSWVAPCACVRDGIKIGENCVVGMGSVITKDVENNSVVMGVPGKKIRDNPIPPHLNDDSEVGE